MTNVIEAMVFTTEVTNVGDVYFRLAKYMFRVKLTLHALTGAPDALDFILFINFLSHPIPRRVAFFVQVSFFPFPFSLSPQLSCS
jgi:hypothetical protein